MTSARHLRTGAQALIVAGSAALYIQLLGLDAVNGWRPVSTFFGIMTGLFALSGCAAWMVWRGQFSGGVPLLAVGAVLFRVLLLPAGLPAHAPMTQKMTWLGQDLRGEAVVFERFQLFDNDVWRYLWEGNAARAGYNPYVWSPASPQLDAASEGIFEEIRGNVSYSDTPSIYPPLAQFLFLAANSAAPGSIVAMKLFLIACDLGACLLIGLLLKARGMRPEWALVYAWNPLIVKVFAGSSHVDALAVLVLSALALAVARGQWTWSAVLFGLAVLAKLSPAILAIFLIRRVGWLRMVLAFAVICVGYLPYWTAGWGVFAGLRAFAATWEFNAGLFHFSKALFEPWFANSDGYAKLLCGVVLSAWVGWIWWKDDGGTASFLQSSADTLGAVLLCSPAVMPWYLSWALPFAIASGRIVWVAWTFPVLAAFLVMVDGKERSWAIILEYLTLVTLLFANVPRRWREEIDCDEA